jgi:hypothetical protein
MYNFLNLMRTRRLLRASCHQSSFSFSLSRARALAASRYIIATCERSFLNFHLFASIYRIARDFYVNALYRRRRHFVFIIGSFYFEGPREANVRVATGFFVKSATRFLSRSLAKRTKKREEYSSRLRTSAFFNRRHIRRVHRHAKKLNLTYFRLRRIALIRFYEQRDRSNIFK